MCIRDRVVTKHDLAEEEDMHMRILYTTEDGIRDLNWSDNNNVIPGTLTPLGTQLGHMFPFERIIAVRIFESWRFTHDCVTQLQHIHNHKHKKGPNRAEFEQSTEKVMHLAMAVVNHAANNQTAEYVQKTTCQKFPHLLNLNRWWPGLKPDPPCEELSLIHI